MTVDNADISLPPASEETATPPRAPSIAPALGSGPAALASRAWPSNRQLGIEIGVVLLLAVVPDVFYAMIRATGGDQSQARPFKLMMTYLIVRSLQVTAPVMYFIWRNREPWARFGIRRVRVLIDVPIAAALYAAGIVAWYGLWYSWFFILYAANRERGVESAEAASDHLRSLFIGPSSALDYVLLLAGSCANGFAEEFIMRGYLLPRLERLLRSTVLGIVATAMMFSAYHVYQGGLGAMNTFVIGLIFGAAFAWLRRIWPLALAHAAHDFLGMLQFAP